MTDAANDVAHWGNEVGKWTTSVFNANNAIKAANATVDACNTAISACNNTINQAGNAINSATRAIDKAATDAANAVANTATKSWKSVKKWFSDTRLKENVKFVAKVNGLNTYTYNYVWDNAVQHGVMAQELLETQYADAVEMHESGYYQVDYSKLPSIH
tara:strand:- start:1683 stop:2159 length:477 start_codon:yes stop_codon:yes gene_type:complete